MKKLIICEKPSLAQNVAKALRLGGEHTTYHKMEGYVESNHYIIVPCFGHLFSLKDIEEYTKEEKTNWKLDNLPFIPEEFEYLLRKDFKTKKTDAGVKKQFNTIKKLIHRDDILEIIHCGDSDREGELIVRLVLEQAQNKKNVMRLWLPDQTEQTILHGLKIMSSDSDYDLLNEEAKARMFVDWLYGINLTRYSTIKSGTLLKVGRVKTAIIKAIYDRDREIKNFKKSPYLTLISKEKTKGVEIELKVKEQYEITDRNDVIQIQKTLNEHTGIVKNIITKQKTLPSPKLFSQSTLQNKLSKQYKYAPDKTLSLVQSLYEKGYVTYPRTPTEYLATAEKNKIKTILDKLRTIGEGVEFKESKRIFDDSKIESHSAISITEKFPDEKDFKNQEERNCYEVIKQRFCSVFTVKECIVDETTVHILVGQMEFEVKGVVDVQSGWKIYEVETQKKEQILIPHLEKGDYISTNFKLQEKETQPPKHYTVETLNNFMKNPFKKEVHEQENDDEEYKQLLSGAEIGTEATRPSIIKECIKASYLNLKGSIYTITPTGEFYIEALEKLQIDLSKEKTVEMNKRLKSVYKGECTIIDVINATKQELQNICNKEIKLEPRIERAEYIGKCPCCANDIIEKKTAYSCISNKYDKVNGSWKLVEGCGFQINKKIASKSISVTNAKKLLNYGKTDTLKGFTSTKTSKYFDAQLKINESTKKVEFNFGN